MRKATTVSVRRACRLVGLSRTVLDYEPKMDPSNAALEQRLVELAHERRRSPKSDSKFMMCFQMPKKCSMHLSSLRRR